MSVSKTLQFASLDDLNLDPLNPRLGRHHAGKNVSQQDIQEMIETWKIDELAVSFLESEGFWTQEALICVKEPLYGKMSLVVVEGNRRLAALRCLQAAFAGKRKDTFWKNLVAGRKPPPGLFEKVPYLMADSRESVEAYLGFRHVTGIEEWKPSEKAEFISKMVERGMSYEEVRRKIGARLDTVRRNYISYRLLLQIEDSADVPTDNFEKRFSVMFLSLRSAGVQRFLQIDIEAPPDKARRPVPSKHLKALADFARWMFGDEKSPPLFSDSREADQFGRVLESPDAVNYLRASTNPSFEVAVRLAGGDEPEVIEQVEKASECLELALSTAHHHKRSAKLKKASERLGRNARRLLDLFPELRKYICD